MAQATPKMGLFTWNKPLDPYDYTQFTDNWNKVDYHDHTPGRGAQIPMGGIAPGAVGPLQLAFIAGQIGSWMSLVPNLAAGMVTTTGRYVPSARLEGNQDVVRLKGAITNNSGASIAANTTLVTLPAAFTPTSTVGTSAAEGAPFAGSEIVISSAGALSMLVALPAGAAVNFDGVTYTLS